MGVVASSMSDALLNVAQRSVARATMPTQRSIAMQRTVMRMTYGSRATSLAPGDVTGHAGDDLPSSAAQRVLSSMFRASASPLRVRRADSRCCIT
jgi:hypothetical protein